MVVLKMHGRWFSITLWLHLRRKPQELAWSQAELTRVGRIFGRVERGRCESGSYGSGASCRLGEALEDPVDESF